MTAVLQKLLTRDAARRITHSGAGHVEGPVVGAGDFADATPAQMADAYGLDPAALGLDAFGYVDLLRFRTHDLMNLQTPAAVGPQPWPTYDMGFLRDGAPVWWLERTRIPMGAEYWRIQADGTQQHLSTYASPALGWSGARSYRPPVDLVGTRAVFRGRDLPAELTPERDRVEVVLVGAAADAAEGFEDLEEVRPGVRRLLVELDACERFYDLVVAARWRGQQVRVLEQDGTSARLELTVATAPAVERLGATEVEPGCFEVVAPRAELVELEARERSLPGAVAAE
ncbi:hypothetical protein INN71_06145 [Nocardioides sp. ChNu-153]|uniref:hypothetical protein n=1 Tax=Nocardioides sp. ChNu-153 TaxID=2779364 RepID=UPI00264DD6B6|nr:hypothetical protein [Nocardioides sp. ChNu-153]MDN7120967.1 hypothetical protein [Nocardioides sp. ChNu-153]